VPITEETTCGLAVTCDTCGDRLDGEDHGHNLFPDLDAARDAAHLWGWSITDDGHAACGSHQNDGGQPVASSHDTDIPSSVHDWWTALGQRIQSARKGAGYTQADMATAMGLTRVSISNIEHGRQRINAHQVFFVAEVLNLPVGQLLGDDDPPPVRGVPDLAKVAAALTDLVASAQRASRAFDTEEPPR
jgi:transcriptional regulator with XRE-family HTH domain